MTETLQIHVQKKWLDLIRRELSLVEQKEKGRTYAKEIEGRKYSDKYDGITGKEVELTDGYASVIAKVVRATRYESIQAYLDAEGYLNALPGIESYSVAVDTYRSFQQKKGEPKKTDEEIDDIIRSAGGMICLQLELVKA